MMRYALIAAASAAAFAVSFQLARGVISEQTRSPASRSPRAEPRLTPEPSGAATAIVSPNAPPVAFPVVHVTQRAPTPYERAVLESPREFFAMKMALQEQLVADKHLARECFEDENLVGETTLEFSWWVKSTRTRARASGLRFAHVMDGVALPAHVIACIERVLVGDYEALPSKDEPFPVVRGDIPIRLSWGFPTSPR